MSYIVAFTGGQGSGKTTLSRAIHNHFGPRAVLLEGISERVASRGLGLGQTASLETILAFAQEHLSRERTAPPAEILILDRCLLDLIAYATALKFSPVVIGLLDELIFRSMPQMHAVFYVPTPTDQLDRNSAYENTAFRQQIAEQITVAAARLKVPLVAVPERYDDRLTAVIEHLAHLGIVSE